MDDVVLSVVKNRYWKDLDIYALSLVESGFKGRKVMFVEDVPIDAEENLEALGFEVIEFTTPSEYQHLHFQSYRYRVAADFLSMERKNLRLVLWTDVCDLVFQNDPTSHMERARLLAAKEGRKINAGDGKGWNEIWMRHFLPGKEADMFMEQEVLCSGSIAGRSFDIHPLFEDMWVYLKKFGELRGIDQGIFNYLARNEKYIKYLRIPEMEEAFVSTCGMFMSEYNTHEWTVAPPFLDRENGLVLNQLGKPFAIAHCYDRTGGFLNPIGDFRAILERRYRK